MNDTGLKLIDKAMSLDELTTEQIMALQSALALLGYPVGKIDGMVGPKTKNAWAEYKTDFFAGRPDLVDNESMTHLHAQTQRIEYRCDTKEQTIDAVKKECRRQGLTLLEQVAYVLATVEWETANTFQPVKEAFWKSEEWRKKNFRYFPFYGRGYVQLTWKNNYEKYGQLLGIDLVGHPDLALEPNNALFILVHGFKTGTFTGRKITDYINGSECDFVRARRCINGTDKASTIANLARNWLKKLA